MTASPNQRISSAVFRDNRQYLLALDGSVVYIVCDRERDISVKSSLSADQRSLAAEWVAEVSRDIAAAYGGQPSEIYHLISISL